LFDRAIGRFDGRVGSRNAVLNWVFSPPAAKIVSAFSARVG
jgi:hypothetical protein